MNNLDKPVKSVAVVYHYFALYRYSVLNELMKSKEIKYTLFSARTSGNDIKTIDPEYANSPIIDGGLRWKFIKNKWLYKEKLLWQKGVLHLALKGNFDAFILMGNVYFISSWIAAVIIRFRRKKLYFWTHGVTSNEKGLKWFLRKAMYNKANGLLLYGHGAKTIMQNNGFKKKMHIIYNSLGTAEEVVVNNDITDERRINKKYELFRDPSLPIIIFVGRLTYYKRLDQILEASRILADEDFKINVLFVGDGLALKSLEDLAQSMNLSEYCNFYGPCYDKKELELLFDISSICVSPGEVGLTAMASLGNGTPVITHDDFNFQMPEYEAIIPGVNGLFFKRNSASDLALTIKKWINEHKYSSHEIIKNNCHKIIKEKYNSTYQATLINEIILRDE
jgi:glycosyltransferase involved in cell wall biosynthesis